MSDESHEPLKRLFFALNCPPEQRKAIAQWRSALELRSGRPVPVENFHLTLKFLGAVGVAQIADMHGLEPFRIDDVRTLPDAGIRNARTLALFTIGETRGHRRNAP